MATLPIPAQYVATGAGPGQIPVRDNEGNIPGVPVIYSRTLTDEVAKLTRAQAASGFLGGGSFLGTNPNGNIFNRLSLDATNDRIEALAAGYRIPILSNEITAINLVQAPLTGTQSDLLFVELWFVRAATGGRTPQWRLRYVPDVNFNIYQDGVDDPKILAQGATGQDQATITFQRVNTKFFHTLTDPGLFVAAIPAPKGDPIADTGLDGNDYYTVYGLPLAKIKRLNRTAFNPISNANGADVAGYAADTVSSRPDGLWHNVVDVSQIVDLRHKASFNTNYEATLQGALIGQLTSKLKSGGVAQTISVTLDNRGQRDYLADAATTQNITVAMNLVRNSYFRAKPVDDGIANYWSLFANPSNSVVTGGSLLQILPDGQFINRSILAPDDFFGVKRTISGFNSKQFTIHLGYIPHPNNCQLNTQLRLDIWPQGADINAQDANPLVRVTSNDLSVQTESLKELMAHIDSLVFYEALDLYIYATGGAVEVTVSYLDIKADRRLSAPIELTDGSLFTIIRSPGLAELGATFDANATVVYDTLTGDPVPISSAQLISNNLRIQLMTIPTNTDLRVMIPVVYPTGGGYTQLLGQAIKAKDTDGYVGLVPYGIASTSLSSTVLGAAYAHVGGHSELVKVYNPLLSLKGAVATLLVVGNGTGSYMLPPTNHGRRVLMPVAVRIGDASYGLSSITRQSNGTIDITIAGGTVVASNQIFEVDVATDAPVVVWDSRLNGQVLVARNTLLTTKVASPTRDVFLPVPGVSMGRAVSEVCASLFINGIAVDITSNPTVQSSTEKAIVALNFTDQVSGVVDMVAVVRYEIPHTYELIVSYSAPVPALAPALASNSKINLLAQPSILVHTKGTGHRDVSDNFTDQPFLRDPILLGDPISTTVQNAIKSTLFNTPTLVSSLKSLPLYAGRQILLSDLSDSTFEIEGPLLKDATPHRTVVAMLVETSGNIYLLLVEQNRTDQRTRVDGAASVSLYEPDGRPLVPLGT